VLVPEGRLADIVVHVERVVDVDLHVEQRVKLLTLLTRLTASTSIAG
jgi:hypothetical protein